MPLSENNILFYWTAPDGRRFFFFAAYNFFLSVHNKGEDAAKEEGT